jgi:hypothetical protein
VVERELWCLGNETIGDGSIFSVGSEGRLVG